MVNHFKKVIPFILITIVAIGGVETFYRIPFTRFMQTSRESKAQDAGTKTAIPVKSEQKKRSDPQIILKRNLFGTPPKGANVPKKEQSAPAKLAPTALELSLIGTITGPPNTRRVILLDKKKKVQDIYSQGDTVQGALIKEIQRGKIILNVNGKDEILVPETPKTKSGGVTRPNTFMSIPPEMGQGPSPEIPSEEVVEPEPIVTTEAPEPAEPTLNNTTVEPNATEVELPLPNFSPGQQTNLPNINQRPKTNHYQEKP